MLTSARRSTSPPLAAVVLVLLSFVAAAQPADAHTRSFKFGKKGAGNGEFNLPQGMAFDAEDNLWVADTFNHRIQKFTAAGVHLRSYGSQGRGDGFFINPGGVAISNSGRVHVGDARNYRVQVFTPNLDFILRFGSEGVDDGQFFGGNLKVVTDRANNVYVLDSHLERVQKFAPDGKFLLKFGGDDVFNNSQDLAIDSADNIWVADRLGHKLVKFDANGSRLLTVDTFKLQLFSPISVAVDSFDDVYVGNECGSVGKFDSNGQFLTHLQVTGCPYGLAFDSHDDLYVATSTQNDDFIEVLRADDDGDGLRSSLDLDSDNDGIPDAVERAAALAAGLGDDPDGDGIPNELDLDSDGDGIPDLVEAGGKDENGDGRVDGFEDANQNGADDALEAAPLQLPDTDGDGIPDFLDGDSDDDGATDAREAGGEDRDGDGMLDDALDADDDGLADSVQAGTGTPLQLLDLNDNGIPDYRDAQQATEVETGDGGCAIRSGTRGSALPYILLPFALWFGRAVRRRAER